MRFGPCRLLAQEASVRQYIGAGDNSVYIVYLYISNFLQMSPAPSLSPSPSPSTLYLPYISISSQLRTGKRTEQFGAPCLFLTEKEISWRKDDDKDKEKKPMVTYALHVSRSWLTDCLQNSPYYNGKSLNCAFFC
jgi:hypothetical protein